MSGLSEMRMWQARPYILQVAQALAVSMNKLGDQKYLQGDLHGAKQHYTEALRTRQGSCCPSNAASVETQLGVVTSLVKVLDIEQVSRQAILPAGRQPCTGCCCGQAASVLKVYCSNKVYAQYPAQWAKGCLVHQLDIKEKQAGHTHAEPHNSCMLATPWVSEKPLRQEAGFHKGRDVRRLSRMCQRHVQSSTLIASKVHPHKLLAVGVAMTAELKHTD